MEGEPKNIKIRLETPLGNGSKPGRFAYLRGNGEKVPPPTFQEKLRRIYQEQPSPYPDGTIQHQLRLILEQGRKNP